MKQFLATLTLAASLAFSACSGNHNSNPAEQPAASVAQATTQEKTGAHLCGAPTKKGAPCTRRVSDSHGKTARCWQHQG